MRWGVGVSGTLMGTTAHLSCALDAAVMQSHGSSLRQRLGEELRSAVMRTKLSRRMGGGSDPIARGPQAPRRAWRIVAGGG